jgi:hypothetical protein
VQAEDPLDLGRIGVEAADQEHVLLAVGDGEPAPGIEPADVTGVQPAIPVDGLGGRRGVLEVAAHHVVAADQDLAVGAGRQIPAAAIDDAHRDAGSRPPGGR